MGGGLFWVHFASIQFNKTFIFSFQKAEYKANASLSALNFCQNFIIGFGLTSGCLLAAYFIVSHNIEGKMLSAGDYVLFTTYLLQLFGPLNFFGTIYRTIQRSFIDMYFYSFFIFF